MENTYKKQVVPFTQVPNGLLYDPDISFKAKGIWAYMSAKPEGWNFSADRIAEETREERKAILAGLKELLEKGYITAKKLPNGRMEYVLYWNPVESEYTAKDEPKRVEKELDEPIISGDDKRPRRSDYKSDEEFEKAIYKWNTAVI